MTDQPPSPFDAYATNYDALVDEALSACGETKGYFARERVRWLQRRLHRRRRVIQTLMDFGCGTGSSIPLLLEAFGAQSLIALEPSSRLLAVARSVNQSPGARFLLPAEYTSNSELDLVYCSGVFHHIPEPERRRTLDYIRGALRPGGLFSFWENNPWNLGTRYVMSRIPFDRDAHTLSCLKARRLLRAAGFELLETSFLFVFPHALRAFRPLERLLSGAPLGGQYHVLCMKPDLQTGQGQPGVVDTA